MKRLKYMVTVFFAFVALGQVIATAEIYPRAEVGDAVFRDLNYLGVNVGHAGIYEAYFQRSRGGSFRHSVIQASGDGYTVDWWYFDYQYSDWPTFMGGQPQSAYKGAWNRSNQSPPTWDGSPNSMTQARRDSIITEARRLFGAGYILWTGLWSPSSREPRSNDPVPNDVRCDGLVHWVYERVGFNLGSRSHFATPYDRMNRMYAGAVDNPTLSTSGLDSFSSTTFTVTADDSSSRPAYLFIRAGSSDPGGYFVSPKTLYKSSGSLVAIPVDYAGNGGTGYAWVFLPATASAGPGGTISPSGSGFTLKGRTYFFTAYPDSGYELDKWYLNGQPQSVYSKTISITADGSESIRVHVTFKQITATISVRANPAEGGTVSGGGTYPVGSSRQISASPNPGWSFTGWNDGNTQNPRTITVPPGGASYTANFAQGSLTINPTSRSHTAEAISGQTIWVTGNVTWTATRSIAHSWITITGGSSGYGNGTVTYSLTANTGETRNGTITVSGGGITRTFTITQAGAADDTGGTIFPLSYPGRYVTAFVYDAVEEEWFRILDVTLSPTSVTFPRVQAGRWYWLAVMVYNPTSQRWELSHGSWFGRH